MTTTPRAVKLSEAQKLKRELNKQRKVLHDLTDEVWAFLQLLDKEMRKPSNPERGTRIAQLSNRLELQNDLIRRFRLGLKGDPVPRQRSAGRAALRAGRGSPAAVGGDHG
jgi:hypothetical protein